MMHQVDHVLILEVVGYICLIVGNLMKASHVSADYMRSTGLHRFGPKVRLPLTPFLLPMLLVYLISSIFQTFRGRG